jgi:hypothetical protein
MIRLPIDRPVLTWDAIVNVLGYQPDLRELRAYLERHGYYMGSGQVFRKASALTRRSGREPTEAERRETRINLFPRRY